MLVPHTAGGRRGSASGCSHLGLPYVHPTCSGSLLLTPQTFLLPPPALSAERLLVFQGPLKNLTVHFPTTPSRPMLHVFGPCACMI